MINSEINQFINDISFDRDLRNRILEWSAETAFVGFLNTNEKKIMKKLKTAIEIEDKYDVGLELYVAFIFVTANCQVTYEPDVKIPTSPDFKIEFQKRSFFCEVKRLRNWVDGAISNEKMLRKCGDIICEKVIQTVPNEINIIYIRKRGMAPDDYDLKSASNNLFNWIEEEPCSFLNKIQKTGINSIKEFRKYWGQVSAIIIPRSQNGRFIPYVWENPKAVRPLPEVIRPKRGEAVQKPFRG